jgi:aryl-alcohol dehydrogenase-like predicted oxidoreductase
MTTKKREMKKLGNSEMWITSVGFGAWAIGGIGWPGAWGSQDDRASVAAIHRALELGVNWIDTAAVYGLGHSEEIVASALSEWSGPRPYIFTKCGLRRDESGTIREVLKGESIRRECEDSLRRLQAETIDLYQIHWPGDDMEELEEGWAAMAQLRREGKVRWIGVSNFDVEQMKRAQAIAPITSLQPPYSLLRREIEGEVLPFCQREGIGVIVYSPMASGLLTGKMTRERIANLPENDWRKHHHSFQEPELSEHLALVERLRAIGREHGRSPGEAAIAWTLGHPAVTAAIVGARSAQQVDGVIGARTLRLTSQERAKIEARRELAL